ncbi:MAG TPA: hypothetical protein VFM88_04410 [Vicinamibacteria bacterium]|nr:hypothetical protein [Vicinamibacteria bacterium]
MSPECGRALGLLDSYLCDELPSPEGASVREHLAGCAACASEIQRRLRLRAELRNALDGGDVLALEARILAGIAVEGRRRRAIVLGAAAAAALVALAVLVPSTPPSSASSLYDEARDAHLMCAVRASYPSPLRPELAAEGLGRYASLWPAVAAELHAATLLSAHVCPHGSRSYGHVVLRKGEHLVSVLATDGRPLSLPRATLGQDRDGVRLSAATSDGYAAFVLSDLDSRVHSTISEAMLASVLRALAARPGRP